MEDFEVYLGMKVAPFQNTCGSWVGGAWARSDSLYVVAYDETLQAWLLNDGCYHGGECDAFNACDFEPFDYGWTNGIQIPDHIAKSAEQWWGKDKGNVVPERNSIEWQIICVEWMIEKIT